MFKDTPYYGTLDEVLHQLGDSGAFNIRNYVLILFPIYFAGMYAQVFVFEALDIDYRCKIKECEGTGNSAKWKPFAIPPSKNHAGYARCRRYTAKPVLLAGQSTCSADLFTKKTKPCTEYVYNEKTAVKDFNLGCQDGTKLLIAVCHNLGLFLSLPLAGFVSDRFGRKVAVSVASLMAFIFGLMRSFSVNFQMFLALEIIEAGLGAGAYSTGFVLAMEIVGPNSRVLAGTIINTVYISGTTTVGGLAWMLHDWRLLLRVIYTPAILFFSYIWILDESVRWLLTKGRNREAVAILEKAAKMNNVTLAPQKLTRVIGSAKSESTEKSHDQLSNISQMSEEQSPEKPLKSSVRQVYESAELTKTMASCSILWFTVTFIYYGLSINSVYIGGNKYINFMMVAFIEIPAYFAFHALADMYKRRRVITYSFVVAAISCLGILCIPHGYAWICLSFYLSAKFFITMAYTGIFAFVSNVVPAHLRQFLLAVCSTLGRFGGVLAPFTPLLTAYYFNLPAMLFGTLAGAAVFNMTLTANSVYADENFRINMYKETPYYGPLDEVLRQLGDSGAFNIRNYVLILFPIYFAGMYGQVFVFEALDIDYRCKIKECEGTGNSAKWKPFAIPPSKNHAGYARCRRYTAKPVLVAGQSTCSADLFTKKRKPCTEYVYNEKTAVKDFNLGCQDGTKSLIAACHNLGLFSSLPLAGFVSDRFGRKVAVSVASLMAFIFGLMRSFSVNFQMLLALEFIEAVLGAGAYSTGFVLAMEIVGPDSRVLAGTIINSVYIAGTTTVGGLAWMLHDWRLLLRVIYTPAILFFSYIWILDESVRWLLTKGRNREAVAILEKAAKMNNVTLAPHSTRVIGSAKSESTEKSLDELSNISQMSQEQRPEKPQKSSVRQVYESAELTKTMASCSILWFTVTFIYYGLSINSVYIGGNKYINFMMVAFIEIPAYWSFLALAAKYTRRRVIIYAFLVGAISCLGIMIIPYGYAWIVLPVYLSAKFFITMAYTGIYLFVSDVVPAHLRQFLLAVCSSLGRFGAVLAPFTPLLAVYYYNLPAMLFGTLAGAAVLNITVTLNSVYADEVSSCAMEGDHSMCGVPSIPKDNTKLCSANYFCQFEAYFHS